MTDSEHRMACPKCGAECRVLVYLYRPGYVLACRVCGHTFSRCECESPQGESADDRRTIDDLAEQLAAAREQIERLRAENHRLALAVASQTGRIAELERMTEGE